MNRDTQSILLTLLGGAVVRISADDTYLRYVRGWTRPYLLAAGTVLVVLGLVSLWSEHVARRPVEPVPAAPDAQHDPAAVADHDHGHGPAVAWLLLLPVFAIFLVAPPALGSYAADRGGNSVTQPQDSEFAPLPSGDPVATTLTDYATRAIWDQGRSLAGRRVRLVGFVSARPGGGYYLTRMVITCCAADARPVKVTVRGGPNYPADSWIAVTGSYGGLDDAAHRSGQVPVIRAESVEPVRVPSEPYES